MRLGEGKEIVKVADLLFEVVVHVQICEVAGEAVRIPVLFVVKQQSD
jgi:hypothetical protein